MLLGAVPASVDERTVLDNLPGTASGVEAAGVRYEWRPYAFSWRWGVEGDFGHQGWHGLKAEMYDDFIRLGATERAFNGMVRKAEASGMKDYYLYTCVDAPRDGLYDAEWGGIRPVGFYVGGERREPAAQVVLKKGINEIVLHYDSFGTARFALRDGKADIAPETLAEAPLRMKFRGDRRCCRSTAGRRRIRGRGSPSRRRPDWRRWNSRPLAGNPKCVPMAGNAGSPRSHAAATAP